jgi:hypothetical protein
LFQTREERNEDDSRQDVREVIVFETNANAVDVFRLCVVEGAGHGFGVAWLGISPPQIRSACELLRFAKKEWPDIAHDVSYMGEVVADALNKRQAKVKQ